MSPRNDELLSIAEKFNFMNPAIWRGKLPDHLLERLRDVHRDCAFRRPPGPLENKSANSVSNHRQNNLHCGGIVEVDI
jgi:hypothetical protein